MSPFLQEIAIADVENDEKDVGITPLSEALQKQKAEAVGSWNVSEFDVAAFCCSNVP